MFITDVCFSPTPQEIPVCVCGGGGEEWIFSGIVSILKHTTLTFSTTIVPLKAYATHGSALWVMIVNRCSIEVHGVATKKD